jgi:Zn-dependent oligopeptidase
VAGDFVEAPSQMLENWGYEPKVLQRISKHFNTNEPLSLELIDKIIKRWTPVLFKLFGRLMYLCNSRYVNSGLYYLRQLFFASFDIKVHTDQGLLHATPTGVVGLNDAIEAAADYTELWNDMRESISLVKSGKRLPGQGSFAHITGGYEAGESTIVD